MADVCELGALVRSCSRCSCSGVNNELFFRDNTMMLFADAKVMCENIVKALEGSAH